MKAMCDAIHVMGMKVGIYSTPWMGTYAGFIGGSAPNAKSDYGEMAIPEKERKQEDQILKLSGRSSQKGGSCGSRLAV